MMGTQVNNMTGTNSTWLVISVFTAGNTFSTGGQRDSFFSGNSPWQCEPIPAAPLGRAKRPSSPPPCPKDLRAAPQTEPRPAARITAPLRRTRKQKRRHWVQQLRRALA
jgi:hypothetical protein